MSNEAQARLKINSLLQKSGWKLTDFDGGKVNVKVENHLIMGKGEGDTLGLDFEKHGGRIDYLLFDNNDVPICVLEAKSEGIHPLTGKEQARTYAKSLTVPYVILSNGNKHFFWNLSEGDPYEIDSFPTSESITHTTQIPKNTDELINMIISRDFIVETQYPTYASDPLWQGTPENSTDLIERRELCFLRPYQVKAVKSIQKAIAQGKKRFLFEMATGTGKTATAAALIRLFIKSKNASRVLFLVDRLELEEQARKAFSKLLKPDITTVVYKERRDSWQRAEVVVTTIQSILNNYHKDFSPTDFDLIISDEAHRLISGEGPHRSVFDYFVGYKLGLTATPKDFLKNVNISSTDPREIEKRKLKSTYEIFHCESQQPTFSYTLADGVTEGYLVNPKIFDCRTKVTTQLLSDEGFVGQVSITEDSDEEVTGQFTSRDYERYFYSEATDKACMQTFLKEALLDPLTGEIGKTIIFAVSQNHASKLTQFLNEYASQLWPDKYQSNFAVQVTSRISNAQQFTIQFANNNLNGESAFLPGYKTSRTRICVTVGMMSTGYDCQDILNLCVMRPIFSPHEFIQIKGRGTRRHTFAHAVRKDSVEVKKVEKKQSFYLFDFFAVCEYFNQKYDVTKPLPIPKSPVQPASINPAPNGEAQGKKNDAAPSTATGGFYKGADETISIDKIILPSSGMSIDQELRGKADAQAKIFKDRVELGKSVFERWLSKHSLETQLIKNAHSFFMMCWLDQPFLKDMAEHKIGKYGSRGEQFSLIKNIPLDLRDDLVDHIQTQ